MKSPLGILHGRIADGHGTVSGISSALPVICSLCVNIFLLRCFCLMIKKIVYMKNVYISVLFTIFALLTLRI